MDSAKIERLVSELLVEIGEDPEREGLRRTPQRIAAALAFLTSGYHADINTLINGAVFTQEANNMIIARDIELYSLCEHHMLPFFGRCHIGYIPGGKIVGVSKLARLVDMYARRLQIQERLTEQVADYLANKLQPLGAMVVIEARHLCVEMRGVKKPGALTITSAIRGCFEDRKVRGEFLHFLGRTKEW